MSDNLLQQHVEQVKSLLSDLNTEIIQAEELGIEFTFEVYRNCLSIVKIKIDPTAKILERGNIPT